MANKSITQLQVANYPLTGMEVVPLVQGGITKQALVADIVALGSNITIANDTTTATPLYPTFVDTTSGAASTLFTSDPNYQYTPATGELSAPFVEATGGMFVNSNTIGTYTVPGNSNGMSAGPMTVTGTVTVPPSSNWIVVGPDSLAPWAIVGTPSNLNVEYNGTTVASIDTTGDIVAAGSVTAFGNP